MVEVVPVDSPVGHILYRSTATQPFSQAQLLALHAEVQWPNKKQGITGLLCYGRGHFIQLLEGPLPAIQALFATIARDKRHYQVVCLQEGTGPARWFPEWSMALTQPDSLEFYWVTNALETHCFPLHAPATALEESHLIIEPHLLTLIHAFRDL